MKQMYDKDFREMEAVMAKTSLTNESLAYRLKKFYDNCVSKHRKQKKKEEELEAIKKKIAEDKLKRAEKKALKLREIKLKELYKNR